MQVSVLRNRAALVIGAGLLLVVAVGTTAHANSGVGGRDETAQIWIEVEDNFDSVESGGSGRISDGRLVEWVLRPICGNVYNRHDITAECLTGTPRVEYCLDGSEAVWPAWARYGTETADGIEWTIWRVVRGYYCPNDAALLAAIYSAWQNMPIVGPDVTLQPPTGWVYAYVPLVAMNDAQVRTGTYTLLGTPVILRATPTHYTWHWGDGTTTSTTSRGTPWPNPTITHTYNPRDDQVQVRLTTTWVGHYSLNGGSSWIVAPGTATTTTSPIPLDVYNPKSHLVDCDLNDVCTTQVGR